MKKQKCLYCGNITRTPHFASSCCGRGMCDDCYNNLQGTEEQIQVVYMDQRDFAKIKEKYKNSDYLCFECAKIWEK